VVEGRAAAHQDPQVAWPIAKYTAFPCIMIRHRTIRSSNE
jgi:hypothetical protein